MLACLFLLFVPYALIAICFFVVGMFPGVL